MLLICKYGRDNLNNLGVNAKQNDCNDANCMFLVFS